MWGPLSSSRKSQSVLVAGVFTCPRSVLSSAFITNLLLQTYEGRRNKRGASDFEIQSKKRIERLDSTTSFIDHWFGQFHRQITTTHTHKREAHVSFYLFVDFAIDFSSELDWIYRRLSTYVFGTKPQIDSLLFCVSFEFHLYLVWSCRVTTFYRPRQQASVNNRRRKQSETDSVANRQDADENGEHE